MAIVNLAPVELSGELKKVINPILDGVGDTHIMDERGGGGGRQKAPQFKVVVRACIVWVHKQSRQQVLKSSKTFFG